MQREKLTLFPAPADEFLGTFGPSAVVEGYVEGSGDDATLVVTAPNPLAAAGASYSYYLGGKPAFLPTKGPARELTFAGYERLYREWWFEQAGYTGASRETVTLRGGTQANADDVWLVRRTLLRIRALEPFGFQALCTVVDTQDPGVSILGVHACVISSGLVKNGQVDPVLEPVIRAMINKTDTGYELVDPWHRA